MAATRAETGQAGLAHRPSSRGTRIVGPFGVCYPCTGRMGEVASCRLSDSVAEIEVNEAVCYIAASNLIPGFLPPLLDNRSFGNCILAIRGIGWEWTVPALRIALCQSGVGTGRTGAEGRKSRR